MSEPWQMENTELTADGVRIPSERRKQERRHPLNYLNGPFTEDEIRILRVLIEKQREEECYWVGLPEAKGVITPKGDTP